LILIRHQFKVTNAHFHVGVTSNHLHRKYLQCARLWAVSSIYLIKRYSNTFLYKKRFTWKNETPIC